MRQDLGLMPSVESFISLRWDSGATGGFRNRSSLNRRKGDGKIPQLKGAVKAVGYVPFSLAWEPLPPSSEDKDFWKHLCLPGYAHQLGGARLQN